MSYLARLKAEFSEKPPPSELPKLTKATLVSFGSTPISRVPEIEVVERAIPVTDSERFTLDRLALAWGMDAEGRDVMFRPCTSGGELADGSWLSGREARAFWLAEAGRVP